MKDDLFTYVKAEPRRLWAPRDIGMFVFPDVELGWNRTYSLWGWQMFPTYFLQEYTVPEKAEVLEWLRLEMEAKGYKIEFTTVLE